MLDKSINRRQIGLLFDHGATNRYSRKSSQALFTPKENCKIGNIEVRRHLEGMIPSNSKQVEANTDTDLIILHC